MAEGESPGRDVGLSTEVDALDWYHTLELAPGVVTPGFHDMRPVMGQIPLPPSLAGKRCLDVGTFDGYWAFEMERRGADEVVAIDILDPEQWDWPFGSDPRTVAAIGRRKAGGVGFEIAARALGSRVERRELSVYEADADSLGTFDLIYLGSLLIHLRDPVAALGRLRSLCRGRMVVVDGIDLELSTLLPRRPVAHLDARGRPWWWYPNVAGLRRLVEAGGFTVDSRPRRLYIPPGEGRELASFHPRLLRTRDGRQALTVAMRGDPHAVLLASPRS